MQGDTELLDKRIDAPIAGDDDKAPAPGTLPRAPSGTEPVAPQILPPTARVPGGEGTGVKGTSSKAPAEGREDNIPAEEAPAKAELYGTRANPVPPSARAGFVRTKDGVTLRYALFAGRDTSRGTLVFLQGRNECIEKYFETARDMMGRGFAVLTFDWRGQGASDRLLRDPMRGYVRSFAQYETDLDTVMEQVALPDCKAPFTIIGHSMGALVSLLASPRLTSRVDRIVALAPLLRLADAPVGHAVLKWAMGFARLIGLGRHYATGGPRRPEIPDFLSNVLTTDEGRHERNGEIFLERPRLSLGGPTVAWVHAATLAMSRANSRAHMARFGVPCLIVAAGDDQVVSNVAMEEYVARTRSTNLVTVNGARHELLQERDRYREQVLAAIEAFAAPA